MRVSSPVALGNPFHASRRNGTIGVPFPSTSMKVVGLEDSGPGDFGPGNFGPGNFGVEVAPGEPGELLLKGPPVFQGYSEQPGRNRQGPHGGRLVRTGDIVTVDSDGFTTIVDSTKELVIADSTKELVTTGGFSVSPSKVEAILGTHDGVAGVSAFGKPLASLWGVAGKWWLPPSFLKPGRTLTKRLCGPGAGNA